MALIDVRIETRYAVFGLTVEDGIVLDAPPIARWTIGERMEDVAKHYQKQRATFTYTLHTGRKPQL